MSVALPAGPPPRRRRAAGDVLAVLALVLATAGLLARLPPPAVGSAAAVLLLAAAAAHSAAAWRVHEDRRCALSPLLAALALWSVGTLGVLVETVAGGPAFPSFTEGLSAAAFLAFGGAVLLDLDTRSRAGRRIRAFVAFETVVLVGGGACATLGLLVLPLRAGVVDAGTALGLLHPSVWLTLALLVVAQCVRGARPRDGRTGQLLGGLLLMAACDAAVAAGHPGLGTPLHAVRLTAYGVGMLLLVRGLAQRPVVGTAGTVGVSGGVVVASSGTAIGLLALRPLLPAQVGAEVLLVALGTCVAGTALLGLALAEARSATEARSLARTDELTGAANRRALRDEVAGPQTRGQLGIVLVDLDGFKAVNDEHGHAAGDAVLVEAVRRLREVSGPGLVVRLGGDEFAVLVTGAAASGPAVAALALRCGEALGRPLEVAGLRVGVGGSVGTARRLLTEPGPEHAEAELDALLRDADRSMYAVKARRPPRQRAGGSALVRAAVEGPVPET